MDLSIVVRVLAGVGGFVLYFFIGGLCARGLQWLAKGHGDATDDLLCYFGWPVAVAFSVVAGVVVAILYGGYLLAHGVARMGEEEQDDPCRDS